ncbi:MAG: bifunctional (p)ppGpp synthetase/guanosine-3',5'-bis(diphosphate) 3'-pyrophosphohydrolase, partial [Pseudomonadota bacterium]
MNQDLLISKIKTYLPKFDETEIIKACEFTKKAHEHQIRASGEPYYYHPFSVAMILAEMHLDQDSIITALLHDTVEDTLTSLEDIQKNFGINVTKLVDGVTKLAKIKFQSDNIRDGENFRKLLLAMSEDIRVLIVKLADRLHNMRTLNYLSEKKSNRIALETLEIFAPLAERIGMQKMKNELQDLAFAKLYPEERKSIINRLAFLRSDEGLVVDKIETHIVKTLLDVGLNAVVKGREKTPFSIWQKMKHKNISFEQLSDIIAFRVIVHDVVDCYQALGIIHAAYHMIPGTFKDYISTPKDNGYRSLHTIVVGPHKQRIEIQIRTSEMSDVNEWGVAAHWSYKQNIEVFDHQVGGKQFKWVRELLKILEHSETEELIEHTKLEMYEDQVFCFTPKGEIIPLPKGATPVDFAYAVHSDIGNSCVGAKINGRIVPLRTKLENGDQVDISTSKNQVPSTSWERFVVTGKAKAEIKRYIKSRQKKEYISLGKSILSKFFEQQNEELSEEKLRIATEFFQKKNLDELFESVGEGTISRDEVLKNILGQNQSALGNIKNTFSFFKFKNKKKKERSPIPIKGMMPGVAVNFAICCSPIPGDHIVGVFEGEKGINIHTSDCDYLEKFVKDPEKLVEVSWEKDPSINAIARLKIIITHSPFSLATILTVIAEQGANINNIK